MAVVDLSGGVTPVEIIVGGGRDVPVGEAHPIGAYVRPNTSTGRYELGKATTAGELGGLWGIATKTGVVGDPANYIIWKGLVDVGEALAGLAFDLPIYISDTDGVLNTVAGTVSRVIGYVEPRWTNPDGTPDRLLRLVGHS